MAFFVFIVLDVLPETPLLRYMADMTPTEKAMLTDRYWPFVPLLVFTCAAAKQPKRGTREDSTGVGYIANLKIHPFVVM